VPHLEGTRIDRSDGLALAVEGSGNPLADLGLGPPIDEDRELGLAEEIDEARGDDAARDVDPSTGRSAREVPDGDDSISSDADVGADSVRTGPVDDLAVLEDEVEGLRARTRSGAGSEQEAQDHEKVSHLESVSRGG
jgi:hypothetical protein